MKKTMKKALIIMAVVMTAMLMLTFAASAAEVCPDNSHSVGSAVILPTCTEHGYTQYYCTICGTLLGRGDTVDPIGHDYGEAYYQDYGSYFKLEQKCQRENCGHIIDDGNTYYSVDFVNPWSATGYDDSITYTKVANAWEDKNVGRLYVVSGATVDEESTADFVATRKKDKDFGSYTFIGWSETRGETNLIKYTEAITENTTLYAAFSGVFETYPVQFINANGGLLSTVIDVEHGHRVNDDLFQPVRDANGSVILDENGKATYKNEPKYPENLVNYYEFKDWNIDINHIYDRVSIRATYNEFAKVYEYIYCDENGEPIPAEGNDVVREYLEYGHPSTLLGTLNYAKDTDRTYIYTWNGALGVRDGVHATTMGAIQPPNGAMDIRHKDEEGYAPVYLVPKFEQRFREYVFDLTAIIPDTESDKEYYLDKIVITIKDDAGRLMSTGMTKNVNGKAVYECALRDSYNYTITAVTTDEKYEGEQTLERFFIPNLNYTFISTTIYMQISENYIKDTRCSCIHHNALFRPLWTVILNLLYRLFGIKIVCCNDMYATLGDVLAYTK